MSAKVKPYVVYCDQEDQNLKVNIFFSVSKPPFFKIRDMRILSPIISLAKLLSANIQGDEGEFYTEENIDEYF